MSEPFGPASFPEHRPSTISSQESRRTSPTIESSFTPDQKQLLKELDRIQPTDNPSVDGILYDRITNGGFLSRPNQDPTWALRNMVVDRAYYKAGLATGVFQGKEPLTPFTRTYSLKVIELLDRLLAYHQVAAETVAEFDDAQERKEGSRSMICLHGLESFRPTGNLKDDLYVFVAITGQEWLADQLAQGVAPAVAARNVQNWNRKCVAQGIRPGLTPEARFWGTNLAPLENRLIDQILTAAHQ